MRRSSPPSRSMVDNPCHKVRVFITEILNETFCRTFQYFKKISCLQLWIGHCFWRITGLNVLNCKSITNFAFENYDFKQAQFT